MRGPLQIKIEGAKELEAALLALPQTMAKGAVRRALWNSLPVMVDAMRDEAPDPRLRRTLQRSRSLSKRARREARGMFKRGEIKMHVGAVPSRLAHLFEFGTVPRYTKKGVYRGRMVPQPYLRPGFDQSARQVLDRFGGEMRLAIEREVKRLARQRKPRAITIPPPAGS
jgi:HK97 gp10 family phage protein